VVIQNAPGNTIGGTAPGAGNVISGNAEAGVHLTGDGTTANLLLGNLIGTDVTGMAALGNGFAGVLVTDNASNNTLGGTAAGAGNVLSGNAFYGVIIQPSGATGNLLQGNWIGLTADGTAALGNGTIGVSIGAAGNTVGGAAPGARNVISSNGGFGLDLFGNQSSGNLVQGNFLGTTADGITPLGNGEGGVLLNGGSHNNTVGGSAAGAGNLISANRGHGVLLADGAAGNLILGNVIGTDLSGTLALGNGGDGVAVVASSSNLVAGNVIAFNGNDGVLVDTGTGNGILGNAIFGHPGLGIELANGGNNGQPFPTLTSAITDGARLTIQGTFSGAPDTALTLEFFANASPNASGYGEGAIYLGSRTVVTDDLGNATFAFVFAAAVDPSDCVSATATDPGNNTSQFSLCVGLTGARSRPAGPPAIGFAHSLGGGSGEGGRVVGLPPEARSGPALGAVDRAFAALAEDGRIAALSRLALRGRTGWAPWLSEGWDALAGGEG
jgi:titin